MCFGMMIDIFLIVFICKFQEQIFIELQEYLRMAQWVGCSAEQALVYLTHVTR